MTGKIAIWTKSLRPFTRLFDKYRIVFWHDEKKELRQESESLLLAGAEKIELQNNGCGVKVTYAKFGSALAKIPSP